MNIEHLPADTNFNMAGERGTVQLKAHLDSNCRGMSHVSTSRGDWCIRRDTQVQPVK